MGPDDRASFQADFGLTEVARPRLIQAVYSLLGLQTFFTAGEKEIKAWTIQKGDTGPVAAGKIHSDFEKGFVRAEVYSVDDLVQHRTEAAIKSAGKLRVDGGGILGQRAPEASVGCRGVHGPVLLGDRRDAADSRSA